MDKKEAIQLCKEHKFRIDTRKIGKYLGGGLHGTVFKYGKDKIVKISFANDDFYIMKKLVSIVKRFKCVPKIYGFGGNEEIYWVAMEYLPKEITRPCDIRRLYRIDNMVYCHKSLRGLHEPWKTLGRSLLRLYNRYGYRYDDFAVSNAGFDRHGNPKMIDLESFIM